MNFEKIFKYADRKISSEEISSKIEQLKKNPPPENPHNDKLNKAAREDFVRDWEEKDKFVTWLTALSTGYLVFILNKDNVVPIVKIIQMILLFSIGACIFYKAQWIVKYAFDKLDLMVLKRLWDGFRDRNLILQKIKSDKPIEAEVAERLKASIEEEFDLINGGKVWKKIEKNIKFRVLVADISYRIALGAFLLSVTLPVLVSVIGLSQIQTAFIALMHHLNVVMHK